MPVIHANQLITLRDQHPQTARVEWFLAVAPYGDAIFHAQSVGGARSDREIHFDTITQGDVTSIETGMTLWVDTTAHDAYGLGRVRVRGLIIHYDSGSTEFTRGETLTGNTSTDTGIVVSWTVTSGTWAGTDAAGDVYVTGVTGDFQVENLNGSAGGANMAGATAAIDSMQVAENDDIVWADDAYLTLPGAYGFRELWGKYPRLTETGGVNFLMDYDDDFSSPQDTVLPPKANAGPPAVAWLDGAGIADISFNGNASYTTEIGAAIPAGGYAWDFADGAIIAGPGANAAGTCAIPNVVQFNAAGFRYVSLTVTDDTAQARQATVYVPVWIFDEGTEDPFKLAEILSQDGDTDNGWRLRARVFQTNDPGGAQDIIYNWPDGAMVVLFTRTWFGNADEGGVGGWCMASDKHYRDNIRFCGWLLGESLAFDHAAGTVEFEAVAHDGIMRLIPGWPFTIEDTEGVPTDWYEVADLNVDRALHYLLEFYSTVNQVCHVERVGEGNARPVKIQSYSDAALYDQAQGDLLGDAKCLLLSDRQGILYATQDPQFLDAAGRGALLPACHLQQNVGGHADWANEIDFDHPHRPSVGMTRVGGFAYETPFLARAPGAAPVQSATEERPDGLIFIDQDEANLWAGLTLTLANLDYPQVPLELVGYWPVFDPAYQEYVELTAVDPLGRRSWTAQDFVVRQVSFDDRVKDGTAMTNLVLEKTSQVLTGEKVEVPETPTPTPPRLPSPPAPPPPWGGDLTHVVIMTTVGIFATETFNEVTPIWFSVNGGLSGDVCVNLRDMSFDFAHGSQLFMVSDHLADGGAFRCVDVWNRAAWTQQFTNPQAIAMINAAGGLCTPLVGCDPGQWSCVNCDPTTGYLEYIAGAHKFGAGCCIHKRVFYSSDALVNVTVGDDLAHDADCGGPGFHPNTEWAGVISNSGGHSLYTYMCGWGGGADQHRGLSTDGGVTVDTCGHAGGQISPWGAQALWHARAGAEVMYWISRAGILDLWYSADHGSIWAAVGGGGTLPVIPTDQKQTLAMHHLNTQNLFYVDMGGVLRKSINGGLNFILPTTAPASPNVVVPAMVGGFPEGEAFIVGCDATPWIHLTVDFGESWVSKGGNLDTWLSVGDYVYQIIPVQEGQVS